MNIQAYTERALISAAYSPPRSFFLLKFFKSYINKSREKIDQFENVLVPFLPTMKGIAEKNSQVTLKKDKQHIIAIKKTDFLLHLQ